MMRLVCELSAPLAGGIGEGRAIGFADRSFTDRPGWREIVAEGDGTTIDAHGTALDATISDRLTAYPDDGLEVPLAMAEARLLVVPGGPSLAPWAVADASPLDGAEPAPTTGTDASGGVLSGGLSGGASADIPVIFGATDFSPPVLLLAAATALALGAGHALTPGHGKSLMAAYLIGTRGTAIHAIGLGLSVTVSHTIGILVLAALVVAAQGVLAPDAVVRWTPLLAAVTIVLIGVWMVATELRRRRVVARAHAAGQESGGPHAGGHGAHGPAHDHRGASDSNTAAPGATITWRSLFALGLAGGIVPSTSALLILLGTIAAGRPVFGVLLVVAFGLGMALVLAGLGVLLVKGAGLLDQLPAWSPVGRVHTAAPLAAAVVVFAVGIWLTSQALAGMPAL
jgi:ABC-type nickel/cobalt efflux system permease component RcnA